jgi:two-component sensor histidine kinase
LAIPRTYVAAKLQEIVIGELHHRVKNTLAIVSAITFQSLRTANSLEDATRTIADRLHALGVAQDSANKLVQSLAINRRAKVRADEVIV